MSDVQNLVNTEFTLQKKVLCAFFSKFQLNGDILKNKTRFKHLKPEGGSFEQALWDVRDQSSVFLPWENELCIYLKGQITDFVILMEQP